MDPQQQLIMTLRQEVKTLKEECAFLKSQLDSERMMGGSESYPPSSNAAVKQAQQFVQQRLATAVYVVCSG